MKYLLLFCFCFPVVANAQSKNSVKNYQIGLSTNKGKAVNYNALGMGVLPSTELMVGGNHVNYRRHGFGISWRVGVQAILDINKMDLGAITMNSATNATPTWLTGGKMTKYLYSINLNYVKSITKKIPFYAGIGITRTRNFAEIHPFGDTAYKNWINNDKDPGFALNFNAGVFIPITSRLILNVGYDHLPQTLFIGIGIASPYNWEDLDMW